MESSSLLLSGRRQLGYSSARRGMVPTHEHHCKLKNVHGRHASGNLHEANLPDPVLARGNHVTTTTGTLSSNLGRGISAHASLVSSAAFSNVVRRRAPDHRRQDSSH